MEHICFKKVKNGSNFSLKCLSNLKAPTVRVPIPYGQPRGLMEGHARKIYYIRPHGWSIMVFTYTFKEGADYTSKVAGIGIALVAENNSYSRSYPYDGDITHQGGSRQKMMDVGVKRILSC